MIKPKILALDLEGTLISSAFDIKPRPGLYDFLEYCNKLFPRIVIMTAVDHFIYNAVLQHLLIYKMVPDWFEEVEYIHWFYMEESSYGFYKDLRCIPFSKPEGVLIIDDMEMFIRENQKSNWIPISKYEGSETDREFEKIKEILKKYMN